MKYNFTFQTCFISKEELNTETIEMIETWTRKWFQENPCLEILDNEHTFGEHFIQPPQIIGDKNFIYVRWQVFSKSNEWKDFIMAYFVNLNNEFSNIFSLGRAEVLRGH